MPTVSVIIPVFNQAKYLPDALNSIIAQSFEDWECIIVNDGSTDNINEIIKPFINNIHKFIYICQENKGPSAARNLGISLSTGKYIQFLDADDIIYATKFEKQISVLSQQTSLALTYTDYTTSSENDLNSPSQEGRYLSPKFSIDNKLHDLILRWETEISIPIHCFMFDIRFFTEHQIKFDETLHNHVDLDCWLFIFRLNPSVYYIDEKLATYRIHKDSLVYNNWHNLEKGYLKVLYKHRQFFRKRSYEYKLITQKIREIKRLNENTHFSIIANIKSRIRKLISFISYNLF